MKSFKKVAVTILAAVMMLLISTTVFAADSPVKTSFNASLTKKTVTYNGKKQAPKVTVTNAAGKSVSSAPVSFVYTTTYSGLKGDTNGDGRISVSDVNMMKRALVGVVTIEDMYAYDVNGDGRFSVSDLNGLLRLLAGV